MDRTVPKELNLYELVLDKTKELKSPKSMKKHILLIDDDNLQQINHLIELSEKKREREREKYVQKHQVEESDYRKKKNPITYKVITTF
jgi:hypothetical protein